MVEIDLNNLFQIAALGFSTAFATVLATKVATKLIDYLEAQTKLSIKKMQQLIDEKRGKNGRQSI